MDKDKAATFSKSDLIIGFFLLSIIAILQLLSLFLKIKISASAIFVSTAILDLSFITFVFTIPFRNKSNSLKDIGIKGFKLRYLFLGIGLLLLVYIFNILYSIFLLNNGVNPSAQSQYLFPIFNSLNSPFFLILEVVLIAPLAEEMIMRAFLLQVIWSRYGFRTGAVLSSLIFAVLHIIPTAFPPIFALGLVFSFLFKKSRSVFLSALLHVLVNGISIAGYLLTQNLR